ncbi:Alpha-ketoglutarate-dependent dioxygenase AlkB [Methylophilaceae bacterium]|nr:Alpha-ketoglutarate-dependent dioxygenase AlkB [Methylophilaceae bacterium]
MTQNECPGLDLFPDRAPVRKPGPASWLLRGLALEDEAAVLAGLNRILSASPLRNMTTPNGMMSVRTSSCGDFGWVSDQRGYRYAPLDPHSSQPWPEMPEVFYKLAHTAAARAGFGDFVPDSCLINQYAAGSGMGLHQDKNERSFDQPIVSVSLGIPAVFLFGGMKRTDPAVKIPLYHGDVMVWGDEDRLRYHGVMPVQPGHHPILANHRINLTFRKAG